jgi:3-hydroxyisobutyrate dehydrogenase
LHPEASTLPKAADIQSGQDVLQSTGVARKVPESNMIHSVAVIGIGAMGAPMARRIHAAGLQLVVCDGNRAAAEKFSQLKARVVATPADCANADIVLVVVSTAEQVRNVIVGKDGVLSGLAPQHSPIIVVVSTVSAEALDAIAQQLPPNVRMIDAPVSGGTGGAERGTLTMLTGGDERDIATATPVFDILATTQIHCGRLGSAQSMKILNNTLGISIAVIAGEVYRLAIERGLDVARVSQVLEACSGRNVRSMDPAGPKRGYAEMARDRRIYDGTEAIMRKDLGLAVEMTAGTAGEYPAIRGLKALIDTLGGETYDTWRRVGELQPDDS